MTESSPQTRADAPKDIRKPYHFTDQDRIKSAETRQKGQHVEITVVCNACDARGSCKHFQADSVCALEPMFKRLPTRDIQECMDKLQEYIAVLEIRTHRGLYFEELKGGKARGRITHSAKKLVKALTLQVRLYAETGRPSQTGMTDEKDTLARKFGKLDAQ